MRITITTIEGTPEELHESQELRDLLAATNERRATPPSSDRSIGAIPPDIAEYIEGRARNAGIRQRVERLVSEALHLSNVEAALGSSERTRDGLTPYLMLRRLPRRYGAFAYVKPANGGVTFRLTADHIAGLGLQRAYRNATRDRSKYQINCPVQTEDGLAEALRLLPIAYEHAG